MSNYIDISDAIIASTFANRTGVDVSRCLERIQKARSAIDLWWGECVALSTTDTYTSGEVAVNLGFVGIRVDSVCDSSGRPSAVTLYDRSNEDGEVFYLVFERISDVDWDFMGIGRVPSRLQEAA